VAKQQTIDDILDEVLDPPTSDFDDEPNTEEETSDQGPPPPPDREEAEGDSDSGDDESQDSEPESAPSADEEPNTESSESEDEDDDDDDDDEEELDPAAKRAAGLQREVSRLRKELAMRNATPPADQGPVAPPAAVTTAQPVTESVLGPQVKVSEDGQQVYVDPDAFTEAVRREAQQLIEEASKPTEQQIATQRNMQMRQDFIAEDPANKEALAIADEADGFITLQLQNLISQGFRPQSVEHAIQALEQTGVAEQVREFFPEVGSMFSEFVEAQASSSPTWKRSVLTRLRAPASPHNTGTGGPKLKSVTNAPQSLAKKGGTRSHNKNPDRLEFEALEKQFRTEGVLMDDASYDKLKKLGVTLEMPGYEGFED
jgi:hypothetical protein